ncbi:MAG: TonB-dependent receptor, partial [Cytophagales bacterium]
LGMRWQVNPKTEPDDLIVHVNLFDNENLLQQQAIGILGVNMVYACFYHYENPYKMIDSLFDGLSRERIEIDFLKITGNDFKHVDNRLIALYMVKSGYTDATLLSPNGDIIQPSETLYKKNILVTRGRFRPPTKVNLDMFQKSFEQFKKDQEVISNGQKVVQIAELTLKNLQTDIGVDDKDFLDRADILCKLGMNVMISNYQEYYRLVAYLSNITRNKIGIVLGIYNLMEIFNDEYYKNLKGGILESFATLFSRNVKLYVYPTKDPLTGSINKCKDFRISPHLMDLYEYLLANDKLEDIEGANLENLGIFSDAVIKKIKEGEDGWEVMVPVLVEYEIKKNLLFGYSSNEI